MSFLRSELSSLARAQRDIIKITFEISETDFADEVSIDVARTFDSNYAFRVLSRSFGRRSVQV